MKHLLLTTIAAVVLVGCGESASDISIHDAAAAGDSEVVKQHLVAGTDVNAKDDRGGTPLHWATVNGHKEIAELLIAKGADVMAKRVGLTPLHQARTKEVAELLILRGANVNAKTTGGRTLGRTPLDFAAESLALDGPQQGIIVIAGLLRKNGGKMSDWFNADKSIHTAASGGNIEAVKQHLAAGADVNVKNIAGKTPLDRAVKFNVTTEIVDLLRNHGAKTAEELKAAGN